MGEPCRAAILTAFSRHDSVAPGCQGVRRFAMALIEVIDQLHLERQTCERYAAVKRGDDRLVPQFHTARGTT